MRRAKPVKLRPSHFMYVSEGIGTVRSGGRELLVILLFLPVFVFVDVVQLFEDVAEGLRLGRAHQFGQLFIKMVGINFVEPEVRPIVIGADFIFADSEARGWFGFDHGIIAWEKAISLSQPGVQDINTNRLIIVFVHRRLPLLVR